jgi:hypothetical protein
MPVFSTPENEEARRLAGFLRGKPDWLAMS